MYKTSFHSIKYIESIAKDDEIIAGEETRLTVELDGAVMTFNVQSYMDRIWGYKKYRKTFMEKLNKALQEKHFWLRNDLTPDERSFMDVLAQAWASGIPY